MDDIYFSSENVTCCSLELLWNDNDKENTESFELYQKEEGHNFISEKLFYGYDMIYKGENTNYEVINLKPDKTYIYKLRIIKKDSSKNKEKEISVKTLLSPHSILSINSLDIANKKNPENINKDLTDAQIKLIKNCAKIIFDENNENILKDNFDGIEIKITHEKESNIYYISFDVASDYFNEFFKQFIEECGNNLLIPCHFIIKKLPNLLIFDLLEKGSIIFTGKRMGGVIASSLVFYILYLGKLINANYGNALIKIEKKCLGVITFSSPSFLTNLTAAIKMKEFTSYFYNMKEEYDFIPLIMDYISKEHKDISNDLFNIINKIELTIEDISILKNYLNKNNFIEENLTKYINKDCKIPFGYYYMVQKNDYSFISINENSFNEFYYFKIFRSNMSAYNLNIYKNLTSNTIFNKETLKYLENKDYYIDCIKIIRRKVNNDANKTKAIIKFKLMKVDKCDNISPDILDKIALCSNYNNIKYIISNKNIYYDNDVDITAYLDDLNCNINNVIINTKYNGEIKVKHILNIEGSGSTRKMLKDNIEKLFLIPFFKLFEIFYESLKNKNTFLELKKKYFGENYEDLILLKSFEKQINIINELLILSRPDLLSKLQDEFINKYIKEDLDETNKVWTKEQNNNFNSNILNYFEQAKKLHISENTNFNDKSEKNIVDKIKSFLFKKKDKNKLFMYNCIYSELENFINTDFDDTFIKQLFIKNYIVDSLKKIEEDIKNKEKEFKNDDEYKKYLNENIGKYYESLIIPNIYFIRLLILVSIEGGDYIKFNHKEDMNKIVSNIWSITKFVIMNAYGPAFSLLFPIYSKTEQRDFERSFTKNKIEEINMKNLFYKNKTKKIIKTNIDNNELNCNKFSLFNFFIPFADVLLGKTNKMYNFSEYSENCKIGKEYYNNFLQIFNNYSNDFNEDIEISIFDNLKKENTKRDNNFKTIKEMVNDLIDDLESKKGFLALLRQTYLIGELRSNIVRIDI